MIIALFSVFMLAFVFFLFRKDQSFLKKSGPEVYSKEAKKHLNLRSEDDKFPEIIQSKSKKKRKSQEILKEFND